MTAVPHHLVSADAAPGCLPAWVLARRLAAAGLGVRYSARRDECQLTILGVATGKAFLALGASGQARWLYEPAAGLADDPAALTAIIAYLLGVPSTPASAQDYRAFPLKGQVGRSLQDRGLAVALRVSEDWESFEATTDIEVTSPGRPQFGTITMSDDGVLDWSCDLRAAFGGNPAALVDTIIPVLRGRPGPADHR
jgi:hypothetical protein